MQPKRKNPAKSFSKTQKIVLHVNLQAFEAYFEKLQVTGDCNSECVGAVLLWASLVAFEENIYLKVTFETCFCSTQIPWCHETVQWFTISSACVKDV